MMSKNFRGLLAGLSLVVCLFSFSSAAAQETEMLSVADGFQFSVRTDYTADGVNAMSRPYQSRFGVEGWDRHTALALVHITDMDKQLTAGQTWQAPAEAVAAETPAQPVVYMVTPEGYQNVTFFSGDMQYAYVLYFAPSQEQSWLLVSRVANGSITPLYQLSNDLTLLQETPEKASITSDAEANRRENLDAFVSLAGRLASGQYHGINYIERE